MKPIRSDQSASSRHAFTPTNKKAGQWVQTPSGFVRLDSPPSKHSD